jgi:hypothetical protein
VAKVGTSNTDRTISLRRLQCLVKKHNILLIFDYFRIICLLTPCINPTDWKIVTNTKCAENKDPVLCGKGKAEIPVSNLDVRLMIERQLLLYTSEKLHPLNYLVWYTKSYKLFTLELKVGLLNKKPVAYSSNNRVTDQLMSRLGFLFL